MTMKEVVDALLLPPLFFKDFAILAVILGVIQIAPIKLNPWDWLKAMAALPTRITDIENMIEKDRAQRWRTEILHFADAVRRTKTDDVVCKSQLFSKETWDDVIDNIDRYNRYCNAHPEFRNGKTTAATLFLNNYYAEALENPSKFLS